MWKQKNARSRQKSVYHLKNWPAYDRSLVQRYSLTVWIAEDIDQMWPYPGPKQRGGQYEYSHQAIEAMLKLKELFHLTNRGVEGFVRSLFQLLKVNLHVPDHTTLSRRSVDLEVRLPRRAQGQLNIVVDSSGLKLYGEGEWKVRMHGYSKHRTWRKLPLMVDIQTREIQAVDLTGAGGHDAQSVPGLLEQIEQPIASLTGDGGYDKRLTYQAVQARAPTARLAIPPRRNARIWQHGNSPAAALPRDQNLRFIRKHGRQAWKEHMDYHRRSLAETSMFRFKTLFGEHLRNRLLATQNTQVRIRAAIMNQMTHLGMPDSYLSA